MDVTGPLTQVNVRLPAGTLAVVDYLAESEERSRAQVLRRLLDKALADVAWEGCSITSCRLPLGHRSLHDIRPGAATTGPGEEPSPATWAPERSDPRWVPVPYGESAQPSADPPPPKAPQSPERAAIAALPTAAEAAEARRARALGKGAK